jgi:hypothetical protein
MTIPDTDPATVPITAEQADRIAELLEICDAFLRHGPAPARTRLDALLLDRGITAGPCWLIDMLRFTARDLRVAASGPAGPGAAISDE